MEKLIELALNDAFTILSKRIPQTKNETVFISLDNVSPLELPEFLSKESIPLDAWFGGRDNGYDGFNDIGLCYYQQVPTTEKEKVDYCIRNFSSIAFPLISKALTSKGLKRVGVGTHLLKKFSNTSVYEMYLLKDFEILKEYYSLYFH
jgi:hypothetical protein